MPSYLGFVTTYRLKGNCISDFFNFTKNNLESNNACINISATSPVNGNNNSTGKSVNYTSSKYHINKYYLMMYSRGRYRFIVNDLYSQITDENAVCCHVPFITFL